MKEAKVETAAEGEAIAARPVVLLLAAKRWISTARLAMALEELGCVVEMMAPAGHPAVIACGVHALHRYDPLHPVPSLQRALAKAKPVAVVAVDELMVHALEELWWTSDSKHAAVAARDKATRELIRHSVGDNRTLAVGRSRMEQLKVAQEEGVAVPETVTVGRASGVEAAMRQVGMPMVLKADISSGGRGVVMIDDAGKAREAWKSLHRPVNLSRAVLRGLRYGEWAHLRRSAKRETREITAQRYVSGPERTGMAVCRDGEVLGCECMEVVRTWVARGPSSVLRVVRDEEMESAMRRMVKRLGVSGFCGFDFIVEPKNGEEGSGKLLLIEVNLRPTQMVHLPLGTGRDLVAAYVREVLGVEGVQDRVAATSGELIALFPQELQRDPESEFAAQGYHDVPWKMPRLIELALAGMPEGVLRSKDKRQQKLEADPLHPSEQRTLAGGPVLRG